MFLPVKSRSNLNVRPFWSGSERVLPGLGTLYQHAILMESLWFTYCVTSWLV